MPREMLINVAESEECRIAVMENGSLEELYVERASSTRYVGNIYKGRVVNVESAIQAAFVDFGTGKNGFLHISDLHPRYFAGKSAIDTEEIGKRRSLNERKTDSGLPAQGRRGGGAGYEGRNQYQGADAEHLSRAAR